MNDDQQPPPAEVERLPVKFKAPTPEERSIVRLHEVRHEPCTHSPLFGAAFIVDEKLAEVECSKCAAKLNPMWALVQLANNDRRMQQAAIRYRDEQKRLAERSRTKCEHCDRMTRISRR